jgi:DNA-binding NtrC family response regulator
MAPGMAEPRILIVDDEPDMVDSCARLRRRASHRCLTATDLRERAGDIRLLAQAFLKRYGQGRLLGYDDAATTALEAYAWPGNVRELQNVVERACALAEGNTITRRDLPDHVLGDGARATTPAAPPPAVESHVAGTTHLGLKEAKDRWMAVLEASYLRDLLDRNDGNISAASKAAGIDRKTFHRLVNTHQIRG